MLDLIVRGDRVVTPDRVAELDIAVQGGRIVAVAEPGNLQLEAVRVLDATGKIVVPGGIEPHAHVAYQFVTSSGSITTANATDVSRAAVFGGTTTILDFAVVRPDSDIFASVKEKDEIWSGKSYADFSYHCMLVGDIPARIMAQVKEAIQEGLPSVKLFTTNVRPPTGRPHGTTMGHVAVVMGELARHGGIAVIHAEDEEVVQHSYKRAKEEGWMEWWHMHEIHSNLSEELSFRRTIRTAEWTGAGLYFVHTSAKEGVNAIADARGRGLPVYGETLHNYLCFNADSYREEHGMKYHTYPSLKSEEDRLRLWDGILRGDLQTVATDEFTTDWQTKIEYKTVADVTGGHLGVETRMGITYTEGVVNRGMSLHRFVDVTSANAAKVMGFYPRKGAIAPGSDADICIIDPSVRRRLTMADLHISDYSIWEGWEIAGWPVTTVLRGKVMVEGGELLGSPSDGQRPARKVDPEVLRRPVC